MTTVEKAENKTEKEAEVYPGGELFNAINRMLSERTPIKLIFTGDLSGDVVFSVKYSDLGLENSLSTLSHPFYRTNAYANFLGDILLRNNMDILTDRLLGKGNYDVLVKSYVHRNFGLRSKETELYFTFHISLFYNLLNDSLNRLISDEVAKAAPATVRAKRVKRGEEHERITTFTDNDNLRLIVPKTNELRICLENALETVLNFYGVKNKEVFITQNMFSMEIEITDQKTNETHQ